MYTYMHGFSPFYYSPFAPALMFALLPIFVLVMVWTIAIKGYALWHAARGGQKGWFIALLIINTLGILEIVYLIWFCAEKNWFSPEKKRMRPQAPADPSSPAS